MSIFSKIKKGLGVGTISYELKVPSSIDASSGQLAGEIVLTAKGAQKVVDVEAKLERIFTWDERQSHYNSTTKRHDDQWVTQTRTVELGAFLDETAFSLEAEETRTIPFVITFQPFSAQEDPQASSMLWDVLDSAIAGSTGGWFGSSMRNQHVSYKVSGDVDLEDVAFDKGDSKTIVLR
ncbi:MAG: hypothetical protein PHU75_10765 [Candidatus Nanopelagicales bacterium]|nr:hypothetical protein [Candidatus Nanopelagicales bacterium]